MIEDLLKLIAENLGRIAAASEKQVELLLGGTPPKEAPAPAAAAPKGGKGKPAAAAPKAEPEPKPETPAEEEDEGPVADEKDVRAVYLALSKDAALKPEADKVFAGFKERVGKKDLASMTPQERGELKAEFEALKM